MATERGVAIDTVPLPERTVRVTIPVDVAYDLGRFQKVLANLAEKFGCPACCSGVDITFRTEREFIVDAKTLALIPGTSVGNPPEF